MQQTCDSLDIDWSYPIYPSHLSDSEDTNVNRMKRGGRRNVRLKLQSHTVSKGVCSSQKTPSTCKSTCIHWRLCTKYVLLQLVQQMRMMSTNNDRRMALYLLDTLMALYLLDTLMALYLLDTLIALYLLDTLMALYLLDTLMARKVRNVLRSRDEAS